MLYSYTAKGQKKLLGQKAKWDVWGVGNAHFEWPNR